MKRVLPLTVSLALVLIALGAGLCRQYLGFVRTPLFTEGEMVSLLVERGGSVRSVVTELEERGMTRLDWRWRLFNRLNPVTIRAGEYALLPGLLPGGLLALLASGDVIRYRFTIIEGWTFSRLKDALRLDEALKHELDRFDGDAEILSALGAPAGHPEGWFLPETYQYVRGDSDLDILERAHHAMRDALSQAWEQRTRPLPIKSDYELLILASIIEKESSLASERPEIAGVFMRRLQHGWRLETDPTVIYGLGDAFDGDIRSRDLRTDNPYNTYTRFGLPPTPIALPARSALQAAVNPASGSAMFFVADGQGGHVFSDTLAEHHQAVQKMLSRQP